MPRFAANLHYLFTDLPFFERFAAAAAAGFRGVEFQVPYDHDVRDLHRALAEHGLTMALFDAPMGDWDAGDRGLACLPDRRGEFRESLHRALAYGKGMPCDTVHVMAGVVAAGMDYAECERTYVANLRYAAEFFAPHGIAVVIEPINPRFGIVQGGAAYTTEGMHGYFLNHSDHAARLLEEIAHPNAWLHLDCYHMQVLEGHLADTLTRHVRRLRHVQIAGVPGRHEPDVGEIHYPYLFRLLDELGYPGWIGCEYRPQGHTRDGLRWAAPYGIGPRGR